jgi:hypothetical protein
MFLSFPTQPRALSAWACRGPQAADPVGVNSLPPRALTRTSKTTVYDASKEKFKCAGDAKSQFEMVNAEIHRVLAS